MNYFFLLSGRAGNPPINNDEFITYSGSRTAGVFPERKASLPRIHH